MNVSQFKRGDFVRVKRNYFQKKSFNVAASPLGIDEVGVVTGVSTGGNDKRPRYVQVNGKAPLYHHSMFEAARPSVLDGLRLRVVNALRWR
jgi:hypothetical protein